MTSAAASTSSPSRLPIVLIGVLVLASIARVIWIDRLPGIDGDEAWYGVNVQVFRDGGEPFWRTGVGNPLNVFHSLPLLALSYVMPVSGTLLRLPEVIWGVLAIWLAYPFFAPSIGRRAATSLTLLLALSPAAIGYSRFGWDPSGTPLACLLTLGFALRRNVWAAVLSMIAALAIHPTNIFLAPIALAGFAPGLSRWFSALGAHAKRRLWAGAGVLTALAAPVALLMLNALAKNPKTSIPSLEIVMRRVLTPSEWLELATGAVRLFSGVSTVADMAGALPDASRLVLDAIAIGALFIPIAFAVRQERTARSSRLKWLLAGVVVSLVTFHVVAGPLALSSGRERYGLFLLVPELLVLAMALDVIADSRPLLAKGAFALAVASYVALIGGGYFYPLVSRGGDARAGLRTGVVEPKVAAFDFLVSDSRSAEVIQVIAEDWYLYWPLRYLAGRDPRFHVELPANANAPGGVRPSGVPPRAYPHQPDRVYWLVFATKGDWRQLVGPDAVAAFTAFDPIGRPILYVVRLDHAPSLP